MTGLQDLRFGFRWLFYLTNTDPIDIAASAPITDNTPDHFVGDIALDSVKVRAPNCYNHPTMTASIVVVAYVVTGHGLMGVPMVVVW